MLEAGRDAGVHRWQESWAELLRYEPCLADVFGEPLLPFGRFTRVAIPVTRACFSGTCLQETILVERSER